MHLIYWLWLEPLAQYCLKRFEKDVIILKLVTDSNKSAIIIIISSLLFFEGGLFWPKTICVKKQYPFSVKKEKLFEVPGFWDKFFSFRKKGNGFNKLCAALIFLVHFSIKRKRTKKVCISWNNVDLYQFFIHRFGHTWKNIKLNQITFPFP